MEKTLLTREQRTERHDEDHSSTLSEAASISPVPGTRERVAALVVGLRPKQWTKNLAIFVGIVFAQRLLIFSPFERVLVAFVIFCLASSSVYLLNDLLDRESDRRHPVKSKRPLASGALPVSWAVITLSLLLLACTGLTLLIFFIPHGQQADIFASLGGASLLFALSVAAYLLLMTLYSLRLKHIVLLDVFIIASGFVLRILAGAAVIPVMISPWLYLVAILLSLFLALNKRRSELVLLQEQAGAHRQILKKYSLPLLDQLIAIVTATTLMAYSLYTFQGPTGNHRLMITIPLVLYGMFRYLYLVHMHRAGGSPEEVLLRDRHMFATVMLCTVLIIFVLYVLPR